LRNVLQRWLAARTSGDFTPIEFFLHPLASNRSARKDSDLRETKEVELLRKATEALERSAVTQFPTLAEVESTHISTAMSQVGNNRSRAADLLGISRSTLRRKLREMGDV
jgi:DNA-binding protein Fis